MILFSLFPLFFLLVLHPPDTIHILDYLGGFRFVCVRGTNTFTNPFARRTHLSTTCNFYLQLCGFYKGLQAHTVHRLHTTRRIHAMRYSPPFVVLIFLYINAILSLRSTKRRCFFDMYRFERIRDEIEGTCSFDILNSSVDLLSVVQLTYQGIGKRFLNSCSV